MRLHRVILQMNRALEMRKVNYGGWLRWQSSGAPVSKWATRSCREAGNPRLVPLCRYPRSRSAGRLLWRSVPAIIVTWRLRSLNSFSPAAGNERFKEKAGDRFVGAGFAAFNHVEQGKLVIPQMRYEPY